MEPAPSAATCRWAEPTLYLPGPLWFSAWDAPWTCLRPDAPRLLVTTDVCATCEHWEPRADVAPPPAPDRHL